MAPASMAWEAETGDFLYDVRVPEDQANKSASHTLKQHREAEKHTKGSLQYVASVDLWFIKID